MVRDVLREEGELMERRKEEERNKGRKRRGDEGEIDEMGKEYN